MRADFFNGCEWKGGRDGRTKKGEGRWTVLGPAYTTRFFILIFPDFYCFLFPPGGGGRGG